ncbi:hypothetical protein KVV02_006075 [Mortierella alpina]|uniref:Uncharacterized protein n=1 Tax=Mortierella alpina TaxID=64518 RepID=A0A9P8A896_MORAP|nr:hypothetical protein KVV02_006075 [Mortierella alpina]
MSSDATTKKAQFCNNGQSIQGAAELSNGDKVFLAPTDRNKDVILDALRPLLETSQYVVEIGSGSGQHVYHFANQFPKVVFQPTEYDVSLFKSIKAYTADLPAGHHVREPLELDTTMDEHWDVILDTGVREHQTQAPAEGAYDLAIATNIFHITSWAVGSSLVRGAGRLLKPGGILTCYGSFKKDGKFSTESNAEFDKTLRGRDPSWGVKDIEEIQKVAEESDVGLRLHEIRDMPSNNYLLIFKKISLEQ